MNLYTQTAFANMAGVSKQAISKAILKSGTLSTYNGTKKIDADSPLSRAYLNDMNSQRSGALQTSGFIDPDSEESEDLVKALAGTERARALFQKEHAAKEKQARIQLELKNAARRGELLEEQAVVSSIMMFIDRLLNNTRRMSGGFYDEMERKILVAGKPSPELKREWNNELEKMMDEGKLEVCEKIEEIKIDQGRG